MKKAFKIIHDDVKLNTIVIIDDIYTTGSTIDNVAQCAKDAGVKNIFHYIVYRQRNVKHINTIQQMEELSWISEIAENAAGSLIT